MSARKKWRLKKYPSFKYESAPSATKAYDAVDTYRLIYAERRGHTHQIDVEVDEGGGWVLYERVVFPERTSP